MSDESDAARFDGSRQYFSLVFFFFSTFSFISRPRAPLSSPKALTIFHRADEMDEGEEEEFDVDSESGSQEEDASSPVEVPGEM